MLGKNRWFCSPSAVDQLRHCFARHALAVGGFGVALHLAQRRIAGDRGEQSQSSRFCFARVAMENTHKAAFALLMLTLTVFAPSSGT
jgi:hypothetical protein